MWRKRGSGRGRCSSAVPFWGHTSFLLPSPSPSSSSSHATCHCFSRFQEAEAGMLECLLEKFGQLWHFGIWGANCGATWRWVTGALTAPLPTALRLFESFGEAAVSPVLRVITEQERVNGIRKGAWFYSRRRKFADDLEERLRRLEKWV